MYFDYIILGAGLYGLYSANFLSQHLSDECRSKKKILILEHDSKPFSRATYINQARVHNGYHYPRSISTCLKSAQYFKRFVEDYAFCILTDFHQVYATSSVYSWTNAQQFNKFCASAQIPCDSVNPDKYFKPGMCDGAFLTKEYTYDAEILKEYFIKMISGSPNVKIQFDSIISEMNHLDSHYEIKLKNGDKYETDFLLNATYASTNQVSSMLGFEPFQIKYELCEIILCHVSEALRDIGITVMDGPFFSIMPFGKTGLHSLTSVTFTPHLTSYNSLPKFECQEKSNGYCTLCQLGNCNYCIAKPKTAWPYMSNLTKKYLKENLKFEYNKSLFSMKPILKISEIDDSRPTVIRQFSENPTFISVLSGKINTVYDLDEVLGNAIK